jgi:hypothetical protein
VGVAVGVAAHLVGSLSQGLTTAFNRTARANPLSLLGQRVLSDFLSYEMDDVDRRLQRARVTWLQAFPSLSRALPGSGDTSLLDIELPSGPIGADSVRESQRSEDLDAEDLETPTRVRLHQLTMEAIQVELRQTATRLVGTEAELFGLIDRLQAEAELRFAIALPLAALVAVLTVEFHPIWLLGLVAILGLLAQGIRSRVEAGDRTVDAIALGRVIPPSLERLR